MDKLELNFNDQSSDIRPGGVLKGEVSWRVEKLAKLSRKERAVEVALGWETSGKGTQDAEQVVVQKIRVEGKVSGVADFELNLPREPWSFEGRLISLKWYVQASLENVVALEDVVLSADGQPVILPQAEYGGLKGPALM